MPENDITSLLRETEATRALDEALFTRLREVLYTLHKRVSEDPHSSIAESTWGHGILPSSVAEMCKVAGLDRANAADGFILGLIASTLYVRTNSATWFPSHAGNSTQLAATVFEKIHLGTAAQLKLAGEGKDKLYGDAARRMREEILAELKGGSR